MSATTATATATATARRRGIVRATRAWVFDLPDTQVLQGPRHNRLLWDATLIRDDRYALHYSLVIAVYRAEAVRRGLGRPAPSWA